MRVWYGGSSAALSDSSSLADAEPPATSRVADLLTALLHLLPPLRVQAPSTRRCLLLGSTWVVPAAGGAGETLSNKMPVDFCCRWANKKNLLACALTPQLSLFKLLGQLPLTPCAAAALLLLS